MAWPSACSAAARLVVIVDLPTPPLPEATQTTFLTWASAPSGRRWRPSDCCSLPFSSFESTSKPTPTPETPSSLPTCSTTACWKWERIGQPGRGQRDDDLDLAAVLDLEGANHAKLDDRPPKLRVDHRLEGLCHLFLCGDGHRH